MHLAPAILGTTAVEQLTKSAATPVLQIGSDKLTRHDLSQVDCFNFTAARNLSQVLHDQLQVKDLKDVFNNVPPSALALPHIGVISLAVLGAAFEAKGIGGDTPLENWARKHAGQRNGTPVHLTTFHTIKKHEQQQATEANRNTRRRRRR